MSYCFGKIVENIVLSHIRLAVMSQGSDIIIAARYHLIHYIIHILQSSATPLLLADVSHS